MKILLGLAPLALLAESGVVHEKDIEYWKLDRQALAMDVVRPVEPGRHPGVVLVHGGGFTGGTRQGFLPTAIKLAQHGYVAATISYRLAPGAHFPAQIHDAKAAVRFLRANAGRFSLDPDHIGAEVGKDARRLRSRHDPGKVDHSYAAQGGQRLSHRSHPPFVKLCAF